MIDGRQYPGMIAAVSLRLGRARAPLSGLPPGRFPCRPAEPDVRTEFTEIKSRGLRADDRQGMARGRRHRASVHQPVRCVASASGRHSRRRCGARRRGSAPRHVPASLRDPATASRIPTARFVVDSSWPTDGMIEGMIDDDVDRPEPASAKAVAALLREARSLSRRADKLGGVAATVDDPTTQQLATAACTGMEELVRHLMVLERRVQRGEKAAGRRAR
jgi:hypothetical protein